MINLADGAATCQQLQWSLTPWRTPCSRNTIPKGQRLQEEQQKMVYVRKVTVALLGPLTFHYYKIIFRLFTLVIGIVSLQSDNLCNI
jgi:hypothetical protein